jgi:hypothetical protein
MKHGLAATLRRGHRRNLLESNPIAQATRTPWMNDRRPATRRPPTWSILVVASLGCGCATLGGRGQSLIPQAYQVRTGPYAVFSNFPIGPDAAAVRSLVALEHDIEATLGIRVRAEDPSVQVYILDDRQCFMHFLKFYYPELPPRRAFFLAQGSQREVYTFAGERLEEDLRHEATHALLHAAVGDLPLWLDEGLAEYFEGPDGRQGNNPEHLSRLPQDRSSGWTPDLARLEQLKVVSEMAPRDYRESWAWVHYLLSHSSGTKAALLGYLADLRANPQTASLGDRLKASGNDTPARLLAHIDRIGAAPAAPTAVATPTAPPAAPTIRLQDNGVEPVRAPGPRRTFFDRFRSFLGFD